MCRIVPGFSALETGVTVFLTEKSFECQHHLKIPQKNVLKFPGYNTKLSPYYAVADLMNFEVDLI